MSEAPTHHSFNIDADHVGTFSERLRALAPGAQPFFDPEAGAVVVPIALYAAAQAVIDAGYGSTKDELRAYCATKRYEREIGGITVQQMPVATDRASQAMISGAFVMATANPEFATTWKSGGGIFVDLDADMIKMVGTAVGQHVADCFAREAHVNAAINDGSITTIAQVDAAI
jgi:hypothetical protein